MDAEMILSSIKHEPPPLGQHQSELDQLFGTAWMDDLLGGAAAAPGSDVTSSSSPALHVPTTPDMVDELAPAASMMAMPSASVSSRSTPPTPTPILTPSLLLPGPRALRSREVEKSAPSRKRSASSRAAATPAPVPLAVSATTSSSLGSEDGFASDGPVQPKKKQRRLEKNRRSAQMSRLRKRETTQVLEERVQQMTEVNQRLRDRREHLRTANMALERDVVELRRAAQNSQQLAQLWQLVVQARRQGAGAAQSVPASQQSMALMLFIYAFGVMVRQASLRSREDRLRPASYLPWTPSSQRVEDPDDPPVPLPSPSPNEAAALPAAVRATASSPPSVPVDPLPSRRLSGFRGASLVEDDELFGAEEPLDGAMDLQQQSYVYATGRVRLPNAKSADGSAVMGQIISIVVPARALNSAEPEGEFVEVQCQIVGAEASAASTSAPTPASRQVTRVV